MMTQTLKPFILSILTHANAFALYSILFSVSVNVSSCFCAAVQWWRYLLLNRYINLVLLIARAHIYVVLK